MQGDLRQRPAAEVVRHLFGEALSGVLALQRGKVGCNLCLQDGRLIFATSNLKRFQLPAWLASTGLADTQSVVAAQEARPGTKGAVDTLVKRHDLERARLVDAVRQLLREITLDALRWDSGEYRFTPGSPVMKNEILLEEQTLTLVREATGELTTASLADEARTGVVTDRESRRSSPAPGKTEAGSVLPDVAPSGAGPPGQGTHEDAPLPEPEPVDPEVVAFHRFVEDAQGKDFYTLLGVGKAADEEEIRRRYYRLARQYHPDAMHGPVAEACAKEVEEFFATVTEAYNILTRPGQRKEYDEQLRAGKDLHRDSLRQDPAELARQNFEQGRRSFAAGELHDATQFFRNAVRLDPERSEYHRELGIVQMQNPRWQKAAEESLRQAVDLQPADARALAHLGLLYQRNGLKRRAIDTLREALEWDPENTTALRAIAELEEGGDREGGVLKGIFGRR
jgi:hypothetical protein